MKRMSRLVLLIVALFATGWLFPTSEAQAGGTCRIWCENGITVQGEWDSFLQCQQSFSDNCSQWGVYGGMFCYNGDEGSGCWIW